MTESIEERFYSLLPQLYRSRDAAQGQPLRALLAVLEGEYQALAQDMQATYDNWFVETCDEWALPYIADLLGIRGLEHSQHLFPSQRRLVANALAYRRRKGTAAALEHVLADVTGWGIRVVEFSELLSVTQHVAAPRPQAGRTVDVRQPLAVPPADGAFERRAYTVDVTGNLAEPGLGHGPAQAKHHPANLGVYIWRLAAYPLDDVFAHPAAGEGREGCFTFDAAGRAVRLFNRPQAVDDVLDRAEAENLAIPLTRDLLALDLAARGAADNTAYYGPDRGLHIDYRPGQFEPFVPVRPEEIVVADLRDWQAPPVRDAGPAARPKVVALDPELGRMRFLRADGPRALGDVIACYTYGFSADLGGGAYSRYDALEKLSHLPADALRIAVAEGGAGDPPEAAALRNGTGGLDAFGWVRPLRTLQAALLAWDNYCEGCAAVGKRPVGVILFLDSGRYGGRSLAGSDAGDPSGDLVIRLPGGAQLSILAADGVRPSIRPFSRMRITTQPAQRVTAARALGGAQETGKPTALDRRLELNGLLIEGRPVEVQHEASAGFIDLELRHCTLMESGIRAGLSSSDAPALRVQVEQSRLGFVRLPADTYELVVRDSIIGPGRGQAVIAGVGPGEAGPVTTLERVTILGETHVRGLTLASDVIFARPVVVVDCRAGRVRRSYLAEGSSTPRGEHCQPELALHELAQTTAHPTAALIDRVRKRMRPVFTSIDPADPAYAQLHPTTPAEIRGGGEAGAEMGAFHNLFQHQREANLRRALDEYLPLGKQVSVHFVT